MVSAAIGVAAALASRFLPNFRVWRIKNTDTGVTIEGDHEPVAPTRNIAARYAESNSLNQFKPITQYLGGTSDTFSFTARLFQAHALDNITEKFQTLVAWTNRDPDLRRPPIVLFTVGDADDAVFDNVLAVIDSISNVVYDNPTVTGAVRGITFTINLKEYTEFSLENAPPPETRYAIAKDGEYMELLAAREYSAPLLGDVIRKRHPENQIVNAGETVKLPSFEAIRNIEVVPRSIALKTITKRKATPQKALRDEVFRRTNRTLLSTVVPRGL